MKQDEDIRNIMSALQSSSLEGDLVEIARKIAHSYYFDDDSLDEQKSFSTEEIGKTTIGTPIEKKDEATLNVEKAQQELIRGQENHEQIE